MSHCFHAQGIFMTWKEYLHVAQGFNKCRYTCHISIHTVAYIYITHKWCECRHIRKEQCIYTVFIYAYIHIRAYTWPNYNIWPTWISLKQFLFPVLNPPIRGGNRSCLRSLKIWPNIRYVHHPHPHAPMVLTAFSPHHRVDHPPWNRPVLWLKFGLPGGGKTRAMKTDGCLGYHGCS